MSELPAITPSERLPRQRRSDWLRWSAGFALALGLHGAAAAALLAYWRGETDEVAGAPLILVELAVLPTAPDVTPNEQPPGPERPEALPAQPKPAEVTPAPDTPPDKTGTVESTPLLPAPPAEQAEIPAPVAKPAEAAKAEKRPQSRPQTASAPSTAERRARRTAAAAAASSKTSDALPDWKSALVNRLERYKRYPPEAQARGEHGIAQLAFSVDRAGGVHNARIARSSGSNTLDRATLSLIERAQPLPPPPADMRGSQIAVVVPIRYNIR